MAFAVAAWFALGAFAGSVAYRLADFILERRSVGADAASFRPHCPRCGEVRGVLANVAVIARTFRMCCARCGFVPDRGQVAWELGVGGLFGLLAIRIAVAVPVGTTTLPAWSVLEAGWAAIVTLTLVVVTLTDLRARIIPNVVTYPMTGVAALASFLPDGVGIVAAVLGGAIGLVVTIGIWLGGRLLYRRSDVFGLGDVKLAMFVGTALGSNDVIRALAYGILSGGVAAIVMLVLGRSRRTTMAYGPALALGAYAALVTR